jgi:hypothetical protein
VGRHIRWALVAIAAITVAGAGWRGWAAAHPNPRQSADERAYARLAPALGAGWHYSDGRMVDPVRWPPGAPFVFSLAERVHPERSARGADDVPAAYPVQAALATALIPVTAAGAWVAAGPAAAIVAAAAVAFYPPLARSPADLLSEPLGCLLLGGSFLLLALGLRRGSVRLLAAAGLALGLTALTRADLLPVAVVLAAVAGALHGRRAGRRAGILAGLAIVAAALLTVVPWSIYASRRDHTLVAVSSGSGANLFIGTFLPGHGTMFGVKEHLARRAWKRYPLLRHVRPANLPEKYVLASAVRPHHGEALDAALRRVALHNVGREISRHPGGMATLVAAKLWRLWGNYTVGTHRLRQGWVRILHLVLLALALAGLALALWQRDGPEPLLLLAILLTVSAVNALLVSEARHALTTLPLLFAAGAAGWATLPRLARARHP